jgi:hypothetical protein
MADTGEREGDAPLQISVTPATLRFGPWSGRQSIHALPLPHQRKTEGACSAETFEAAESVTGGPVLERFAY